MILMWEVKKPVFGDHIKVSRGLYSHHGIYASDDCVIHFAPPVNTGAIDPESARIIVTNLSDFLNGGLLEVRSFSLEETKQKRSPQDIINYAFSRVGEGGYNIISNNCEHFANDCLFGKKKSNQVDSVLSFVLGGRN